MKITIHEVSLIDNVEHRRIIPKCVVLDYPEEYQELEDDHFGMCTVCGEDYYHCEPDATGYKCAECGNDTVEGIANLLLMGRVICN